VPGTPEVTERCKSVLIVEDDRSIREAMSDLLELEGYTTHQAANGKEALGVLQRVNGTCLILLDLMMPVMSGYEFADALRSHHLLAPIPIVAVTAFAESAERVGARAVLRKPVEVDALLSMVRKYCEPAGLPA
jgi:CheY-like chemotaxis protein